MKFRLLLAVIAAGTMLASTAEASILTSNTIASPTIIDFSDQPAQANITGQVQIGNLVGRDVTVASSNNGNGLYFDYDGWGLLSNGTWGGGMTYVSLNDDLDNMIFSFNDGPVSAVGGFMNYAPGAGSDLVITALDSGMNVLESYDVTQLADIVTPGGFNAGAFRGIQRSSADISYFELSGGEANTVDDLTFTGNATSHVPEPTTLALFGMGLAGLGLLRRRA